MAVKAITALDDAIVKVNSMRADVGATVNRLESAINNLTVSSTNQQAAESQIRDVDFAAESSEFTKNQILTQSATAMLSQANATSQGALQLIG
jgi:flagellin